MRVLSDEKITEIVREASRGSATRRDGSTSVRIARAIEAAVLEAQGKQEPVAWGLQIPGEIGFRQIWTVKDEPFNAALNRWPEAYKDAIQVPLYAAPVVPPDMVLVPREPTEAMLDAAMNRYQHVSPEARLRFFQMHRENFRCDYKAMIAAAEGNESK